jgi:ABC-type transport system involved in multi-copper enzyme maturation permease subunit
MKCTKTMLTAGAVILAALALAYAALPQFRALVLSAGPYLLFLLCPLSMMFMMKGMHSNSDRQVAPSDAPQDRLPAAEAQPKR